MHIDRVLIVVERFIKDGTPFDYVLRHLEAPLQCSGLVDNIDILYYADYTPNCDDALLSYCLQKKPQAVLFSLQNIATRQDGAPTPNAIWKITYRLHIPTVLFWFEIYKDFVAEVLERYLHTMTLNVIGGADASSHKALPLQGTNYVYTGVTFDDEHLFDIAEGVRDIPVGFLGKLRRTRGEWIAGLKKRGTPIYITGAGVGEESRTPYKEYIKLMSRLKIALNFSMLSDNQIVFNCDKGYLGKRVDWITKRIGSWPMELVKHPLKIRKAVPILKDSVRLLFGSMESRPRHMLRAREFEAMWCRTFLLSEDNPVTSKYFEPYVDYVPFTSLNDLVEKICYYLENDEERDRIRMQGRATMEKYYNARLYWQNLFEFIGVLPDGQDLYQPGEIWNKAYFDNWFSTAPPGNTRT